MLKTEYVGPIDDLYHVVTSHVKLMRKTYGQAIFYRNVTLRLVCNRVIASALTTRENMLIMYTTRSGHGVYTEFILNGTKLIVLDGVI